MTTESTGMSTESTGWSTESTELWTSESTGMSTESTGMSTESTGMSTEAENTQTEPDFVSIPGQTCGVRAAEDRIVGGAPVADASKIPWQAKFTACYTFGCGACGATVISPYWLVSAAHCVYDEDSESYAVATQSHVRVGGTDWTDVDNAGDLHYLESIEIHPNYIVDTDSGWDTTVIKTQTMMEFSDKIHPACLPSPSMCVAGGSDMYVSGYGLEVAGGNNLPDMLNFVGVKMISDTLCATTTGYGNSVVEDLNFCAGVPTGGKDSCQGDSGGPMVTMVDHVFYSLFKY